MHAFEEKVKKGSEYYIHTPGTIAKKLFFYPICLGHFTYEPGYLLKRNRYDSFLLMYCARGSLKGKSGGKSWRAMAGDVVLLDCYQPHQYGTEDGAEVFWIHFDGLQGRAYFDYIMKLQATVIRPQSRELFCRCMDEILLMFQGGCVISEARVSALLVHLLTELMAGEEVITKEISGTKNIQAVTSYVNEHYTEPLALEQLAKIANLSPYYFTKVFSKEMGMTPHKYVISTRLGAARFLLKTTELSMKEIAFQCGFQSESSFCITFKKEEGCTPSEYKNDHR